MSWISRIRSAVRPSQSAADLDEELRFHLEQRIADLEKDGLSRDEAERAARRQFGKVLATREASRDVKSAVWLESLLRDFRFGWRMLAKYRVASFAAVVSLALAIGACTAAFSLIDALMLRPLPVRDPQQLFDLARVFPAFMSPNNQPREFDVFSYPQYQLLREAVRGSADLFMVDWTGGLSGAVFDDSGRASENVRAEMISGEGFGILGVKPVLGRLIEPADDSPDAHLIAVLSAPFWKRRFGGSPTVLGRTVTIGGKQLQIVGVTAPPFDGLHPGYLTDLWLPIRAAADSRVLADDVELATIWGRLHPGVERKSVREPLHAAFTNALRERLRTHPPRNLQGDRLKQFAEQPLIVRDTSTGSGRESLFRARFRRPFEILGLICALLLFVACSNVANLMLARASARDAEMAMRISLGAPRRRLMQQMLIESLQVAMMATVFALIFASFTAPAIVARLGPSDFPAFLEVEPNGRTLAFAAALSLLSTILFGIVPALRASSAQPEAALKATSTQHSARRGTLRWMLAAQIGFSVAVLFLSGLLLLSFRKLITVDLGFNAENVVLFDLGPRDQFSRERDSGQRLVETIRRLPGVVAASLTAQRPMGGDMAWIMTPFVRFAGRAVETIRPREIQISDGFFNAMQIRWIAGRDFLPEEIARPTDSVIVNQAFVDTYLGAQNPIGVTFEKLSDDPKPVRCQIVGVAGTIHYNNLREEDRPTIYSPMRDAARGVLNVRTASKSGAMVAWLRQQIESAAPAMEVRGSILLTSQIENTLLSERLLALLAGFFSVVAVVLAVVGLYGVINYSVVRRTREIGIRIALGARRDAVVRLVASDSSIPVAAGIVAGTMGGVALARYVVSQLFEVKPVSVWSLAGPVVCIVIAAAAAILPPALRAAGSDPLQALRHE
jgi:predicted permease